MAGLGSLDADAIGSGTAFAVSSGVNLIRCVSHSRFHGYPRLLGVVSWRGCRLQFTDTICRRCATRATAEANGFALTTPPRRGGDWTAALFVGLPLTTALVLAATPCPSRHASAPRHCRPA